MERINFIFYNFEYFLYLFGYIRICYNSYKFNGFWDYFFMLWNRVIFFENCFLVCEKMEEGKYEVMEEVDKVMDIYMGLFV